MFYQNIAYRDYDRTPIEPEIMSEKKQTNELQREDHSVNCAQENGFFKGLSVSLSFSIAFWVIFVVVLKAFFNSLV